MPCRKCGSGRPIIWPIDTYISTTRNTTDTQSRVRMAVNPSLGASFDFAFGTADVCPASAASAAPKPAFSTAAITAEGSVFNSSYVHTILFASRFTCALSTPSKRLTAFSTAAEQAAQLIPVTENFFFVIGNTSPSRGKLA